MYYVLAFVFLFKATFFTRISGNYEIDDTRLSEFPT
jgi:hypothetical protein